MENSGEKRSRRVRRSGLDQQPRWAGIAAASLPVIACFLGGATAKWAEGIVVLLLGCLLLASPPRHSLGRALNGIMLALVGCGGIAFLPARWFAQPEWRTALTNDFGIALPPTLSPQPWVTLGYLLSFIAGLSWLYYACAREEESRQVRRELRWFASGIALLGFLCVALYLTHTALTFWHNERRFGPFPNRNQTADMFGISAVVILACGYDDLRNGRKRWLFWLAGLALVIAAIVFDFSRAGIVILLAGAGLWVAIFAFRRASAGRIAGGVSLLLVLLTALLLFGGPTLERFHLRGADAGSGINAELRWLIFRDAWHLIRESSWSGIGLGNFNAIFAIFRDASGGDTRALHPESDWLWFWAEAGWPALLLTIAGTVLLACRLFPFAEEKNRRLRAAAAIAALLFALHGFVDVSAHRVGTAYAAFFLLGLAIRRSCELRSSRLTSNSFRVLGALFVVIGATWTASVRWHWPLPGNVGAENAYAAAAIASKEKNYEETIAQTSRALEWTPLDWSLYFLRALGEAASTRSPVEALDDFRRARFLEPNAIDVPFEEGRVWLTRQPTLTITAWREALRRAGSRRPEVYDHMLALAQQFNPALVPRLQELGQAHHELALVFLSRANGPVFDAAADALIDRDPDLQTLNAEEKTRFFESWAQRGDLQKMVDAVRDHPAWEAWAWRGLAREAAGRGDFARAVAFVRQNAKAPALPAPNPDASPDSLQRTLATNPRNYGAGFALLEQQRRAGQTSDALVTVRRFTSEKDSPRYFHFLEMEAWADIADWANAWHAWQRYDAEQFAK